MLCYKAVAKFSYSQFCTCQISKYNLGITRAYNLEQEESLIKEEHNIDILHNFVKEHTY